MENIFQSVPRGASEEVFTELFLARGVRIERIVSHGHTAPAEGWFDQDENEWVIVLEGCGRIQFDDGNECTLRRGDYLEIPAHRKHRVVWTDPSEPTVWLAVFHGEDVLPPTVSPV